MKKLIFVFCFIILCGCSRFNTGDRVVIEATGESGTIIRILPHPYAPDWLVTPNYLVRIDEKNESYVFKDDELDLRKDK